MIVDHWPKRSADETWRWVAADGVRIRINPSDEASGVGRIQEVVTAGALPIIDIGGNLPSDALIHALRSVPHKSGVLIAQKPAALVRVSSEGTISLCLLLEVGLEREFAALEHCPYDGVMVTVELATPERVQRIHHSGKQVYVLIPATTSRLDRTVQTLTHQGIDAIVTDAPDAVLDAVNSELDAIAARNAADREAD